MASLVSGAVLGLLIGLVARRPRSWKGFAVCMVLLAMMPFTASSTVAYVFACDGDQPDIFVQYLLASMLIAINVSFLVRQFWIHRSWHPAK